jgi:hypothetical protein
MQRGLVRTSLMIPHRSRRKADRLEAWPPRAGLNFILPKSVMRSVHPHHAMTDNSESDARRKTPSHGIEPDCRNVKCVDHREMRLDIDLRGIGGLGIVVGLKLSAVVLPVSEGHNGAPQVAGSRRLASTREGIPATTSLDEYQRAPFDDQRPAMASGRTHLPL